MKSVEDTIRSWEEWEEERRQLEAEARERPSGTSSGGRSILDEIADDLNGISVAEVEQTAREYEFVSFILEERQRYNLALSGVERREARLVDQLGRAEVRIGELEAWNTGLRNENQWLRDQIGS